MVYFVSTGNACLTVVVAVVEGGLCRGVQSKTLRQLDFACHGSGSVGIMKVLFRCCFFTKKCIVKRFRIGRIPQLLKHYLNLSLSGLDTSHEILSFFVCFFNCQPHRWYKKQNVWASN